MRTLLHQLRQRLQRQPRPIPDALWHASLAHYPFLARLTPAERGRLRLLCAHFLQRKQFSGAHGLHVTDAMALEVAAQACLPLLRLGSPGAPQNALDWYADFVGIVLYPGDALARRQSRDEAGVLHHYTEALAGEAMPGGPLVLSWPAVQEARHAHETGQCVVIHEFVHKMDMQSGGADGAPPLPSGFMGAANRREAAARWQHIWASAYASFREQVSLADRFGTPAPWLDAYGASAPAEFFAVACEAHFAAPERFAQDFPSLSTTLRAFFRQDESLA